MNAAAQELIAIPTRRDRWGRYEVVDPKTGKLVGLTRATTISGSLDDKTNLIAWKARTVIVGLATRPDLVALAGVTDATDKRTLDDIAERASDAGGATLRRDLGTAVHGFFAARVADPAAKVPAPYDADVAAILAALDEHGLEIVEGMSERMVVLWRHRIAGTFDLIVRERNTGTLHLVDLKTGSSLLGALGFSTQLSIYAQADVLYQQGAAADGSEDVAEPMPEVSQSLGFILHCQPGTARCDVHALDLTVGAEALELAMQVREMRKAKPLTPKARRIAVAADVVEKVAEVFAGAVDVSAEAIGEEDRAALRERMHAIVAANAGRAADELLRSWPADVPTLKSGEPISHGQHSELLAVLATVEKNHGVAFPETFTPPPKRTPKPSAQRRPAPDEGGEIADPEAASAALNDLAEQLDAHGRAWLVATLEACRKANRPVSMNGQGGKATQRRLTISAALMVLAPMADDQLARALVSLAIGEEMQPGHDLGDAVGALTIDEAQRLHKLAEAIDSTALAATWHEDRVEIVGDIQAALAA
jgi:hypothetical protein